MHENWKAFQFFLKVRTQWRYSITGSITGLDYSSVALPLSFYSKKKQKKLFKKLQFIETGALEALRKNE